MQIPRNYYQEDFSEFSEIFAREANYVIKEFRSGEYLKTMGKAHSQIFYIISGMAYLSLHTDDGKEKIVHFNGDGAITPLYKGMEKFTVELAVSIRASTHVKAYQFSLLQFRKLMDENPDLRDKMFSYTVRKICLLLYESVNQLYNNTMTKTCNFLFLYFHNSMQNGKEVSCKLSQEKLATAIGVSRVHASRVLRQLQEKGIVSVNRSNITLLNREKLQELCSFVLNEGETE